MTFTSARSALLLDQVASEFEAGRTNGAVLLLAGVLDAVATDPTEVAAWRDRIARHPVSSFIGRQTPAQLARPAPDTLGAWPRQLHAAVSDLGFVRGLKARRELGARAIEAAWQQGQRIALIECGELGELDRLRGRALDNVVLIDRDLQSVAAIGASHIPPLATLEPGRAAHRRFDLLVTSADHWRGRDLAQHFAASAALLAPGGSLLLAAFAPGHLGAGWQAVCMGTDLNCHDESRLTGAARTAGLAITHYRDSSGSQIWAALQHATANRAIRGKPTWISPLPSAH